MARTQIGERASTLNRALSRLYANFIVFELFALIRVLDCVKKEGEGAGGGGVR